VALLANVEVLTACECSEHPPCELYSRSPIVFLGTVTEVIAPQDGKRSRARMRVDRAYKGVIEEPVILSDDYGSCGGPDLKVGEQYLIYTRRFEDQDLPSSSCMGSRNVKNAAEDLQFLDGLAKAEPTATVFGVVSSYPEDNSGDVPVSGALVKIRNEEKTFTTTSNENGRYTLSGLAPAKYTVSVSRPGLRTAESDTQPLEARGCAVVDLLLGRDWPGAIEGRVLRPDGTGAAGVDVALFHAEESTGEYQFSGELKTNAQGEYSIPGLAPGPYKVAVHSCCFPTPAIPYPAIYWPASETEEDATEIRITDTPVQRRFDFWLPPEVKSKVVTGVVVLPDGKPVEGARIWILHLPDHGVTDADAITDAAGHFSFRAMDGIEYCLTALGSGEQPLRSRELHTALGEQPGPITLVLERPDRPI
jgi:Carboxypeptidase regulatory-like domain